jgi:protein tyrosine/serine phosphatase
LPAFDLSTPAGRLKTQLDYLWTDHAYLRLGFQNAHWVSPEMARCNQPWPFQLAGWKKRGIRTVINLRGGHETGREKSFYILEKAACERLGLNLVTFPANSREVPKRQTVLDARALFETLEYPAVMHCKSGADRAGMMAVLYAHFRLGQPIRQALSQLSGRYLHVKAGKPGVIDYGFERYLADGEPAGLSYLDWVQSDAYDPKTLKADFHAQWWATVLTDKLLRRE